MAVLALAPSRHPASCHRTPADRERRDIAVAALVEHGLHSYTPSGAFYIMVDTLGGRGGVESSTDFASRLLADKHVAVAPGDTFGSNAHRFVRIRLHGIFRSSSSSSSSSLSLSLSPPSPSCPWHVSTWFDVSLCSLILPRGHLPFLWGSFSLN